MNLNKLILLLEMPISLDGKDFREGAPRIPEVDELMEDTFAEPIDSFNIKKLAINVFDIGKPGGKLHEYVFRRMDDDATIAVYSGIERGDGGIETGYIETLRGVFKGGSLMGIIYSKWLLTQYTYIISDNMLSGAGFAFWYRNFDVWKKLGFKTSIADLHTDKEIPLQNKDQLEEYMGKQEIYGYYRFKVTRK